MTKLINLLRYAKRDQVVCVKNWCLLDVINVHDRRCYRGDKEFCPQYEPKYPDNQYDRTCKHLNILAQPPSFKMEKGLPILSENMTYWFAVTFKLKQRFKY